MFCFLLQTSEKCSVCSELTNTCRSIVFACVWLVICTGVLRAIFYQISSSSWSQVSYVRRTFPSLCCPVCLLLLKRAIFVSDKFTINPWQPLARSASGIKYSCRFQPQIEFLGHSFLFVIYQRETAWKQSDHPVWFTKWCKCVGDTGVCAAIQQITQSAFKRLSRCRQRQVTGSLLHAFY